MSEIERINAEIEECLNECSAQDWDGYGAHPMRQEAAKQLAAILGSLSESQLIGSSICPEPDGSAGVEWRKDNTGLVISCDGKGSVYFAGVVDGGSFSFALPIRSGDKSE